MEGTLFFHEAGTLVTRNLNPALLERDHGLHGVGRFEQLSLTLIAKEVSNDREKETKRDERH